MKTIINKIARFVYLKLIMFMYVHGYMSQGSTKWTFKKPTLYCFTIVGLAKDFAMIYFVSRPMNVFYALYRATKQQQNPAFRQVGSHEPEKTMAFKTNRILYCVWEKSPCTEEQ